MFADRRLDLVLTRVGTGVTVLHHGHDVGKLLRVPRHFLRVDGARDVVTTFADEDTDAQGFLVHRASPVGSDSSAAPVSGSVGVVSMLAA
jgi:hypothetical protein